MRKKYCMLVTCVISMVSVIVSFLGLNISNVKAEVEFDNIQVGTVNVEYLNLRQGISRESEIIEVLERNTEVRVYGKIGDWKLVYIPEQKLIGAVFGEYLSIPEQFTNNEKENTTSIDEAKEKEVITEIEKSEKEVEKKNNIQLSSDERKILEMVNKARLEAGINELYIDENLLEVARLKADDMKTNNYFAHNSPTHGSPFEMMKKHGIIFKTAGENIAGHKTVEGAFEAWMDSQEHKKNIINQNFKSAGIGVIESPIYGKIIVQMFKGD